MIGYDIDLPKKGEIVSLEEIRKICNVIGGDLIYLWQKIRNDPPKNDFVSDGCSCWPDRWTRGVDLYPACFLHDLKYWAGYPGEDTARFLADIELARDVVVLCGGPLYLAKMMLAGVQAGGAEWLKQSFSWGFGRV